MSDNKNEKITPIKYIDIAQLAASISKWNDTYDSFIWLLAEMELRLQLNRQPLEEEIHSLAIQIAQNHPSLQELHWFLAEKTLFFQRKKPIS